MFENVHTQRIDYEMGLLQPQVTQAHWVGRNGEFLREALDHGFKETWLEIGAGTGDFFIRLAELHPEVKFLAVERDKTRALTLLRRCKKLGYPNLSGFRANIMPALYHGIPQASLDRIYIMYPCPWPKTAHRKNRWHLSPVMPQIYRALKPGGHLIMVSDQSFYIDEAHYVLSCHYKMNILDFAPLSRHPLSHSQHFEKGRTKFERTFLAQGQPYFEVIAQKTL